MIELDERFTPDAVAGLDQFSHLEVVYLVHLADPERVESGARHPRANRDWPCVGIFAQRGKDRPNRLGVSRCRLVRVDNLALHVKPWMEEFGPHGAVEQPAWARELMARYW